MKTCRPPKHGLKAGAEHAEAFKALAHVGRLRVYFFLVGRGRPAKAGEIQEAVDLPGPTLSHQLEVLRRAGLIERRREARFIYYSVRSEMVTDLVRLLSACC